MAQWRKVVVAGSSPEFNGATLSGDLTVAGGDIVLGSTSIFSGGDTAQLNNIDALDATTEATIESAIDTLSNLTAASSLVTVSTLGSGSISSGFGNIDIGTSTFNAGNSTVDTLVNDSSVAASRITGSFTGSFVGDGSSLTGVAQDIELLDAYGAATLHQTQDKFLVSDNGTEKSITFSKLEDSIFANVSGDIAIAAGGAATIQANSVALTTDTTGDYIATITGGTGIDSSASGEGAATTLTLDLNELTTETTLAQDDFIPMVDTDDSSASNKITFSNFEDEIFGNISGDATVAAGGALTIDDAFLVNDASDSTSGTITAAGFTTTATGSIAHIKASDEISGSISQAIQAGITTMANLTTVGTIGSGTWEGTTVAVDQGGTGATTLNNLITLGTHSTGNYVATVADSGTGGITVANSGAETAAVTLELDINGLTAAAIASGDMIAFSDEGSAGDPSKKESIDDIATLFAGDALAASSAVLAVQVDDTTIETNSDALRAKTAAISDGGSGLATADQIHTFYTAGGSNLATAFNTDLGGDFIIGNQSSDTATFSGPVTIAGNLDVNGTLTTIDSTNLRVADRFIYASSGSTSGDGGLIVGTGADGVGTAIGYDDSASRWALTKADDTAEDATSITPRQYVVSVSGSAADASSNPSDFGSSATDRIGMMHVNTSTGDIFIFS